MAKLGGYHHEAGLANSPLCTAKPANAIELFIEQLVFGLGNDPVSVPAATPPGAGPWVVIFGGVYLQAIGALAFPSGNVFSQLGEISKDNFTNMAGFEQAQIQNTASLSQYHGGGRHGGCFPEKYFGLLSATAAIECMDSARLRTKNFTKTDSKAYYSELSDQNVWFSAA